MKKLKIPQATRQGYVEIEPWSVFDHNYLTSKTRRGRVQGGQDMPYATMHERDISL